jgi:cellobiose phosphorylase
VTNSGKGKPARVVVDGKPVEGTLVPWAPEGSTITIEVEV